MEILLLLALIVVIVVFARRLRSKNDVANRSAVTFTPPQYRYRRKDGIMTTVEAIFFKRLETIASDRYYIFPQIHLSALLKNETNGKYWKAAFQRINRTSVDYVLCHKDTLQVAYAVELDDWSHDSSKRQTRDRGVEGMFAAANIPLLRFRDVAHLTDDDIARRFYDASQKTYGDPM